MWQERDGYLAPKKEWILSLNITTRDFEPTKEWVLSLNMTTCENSTTKGCILSLIWQHQNMRQKRDGFCAWIPDIEQHEISDNKGIDFSPEYTVWQRKNMRQQMDRLLASECERFWASFSRSIVQEQTVMGQCLKLHSKYFSSILRNFRILRYLLGNLLACMVFFLPLSSYSTMVHVYMFLKKSLKDYNKTKFASCIKKVNVTYWNKFFFSFKMVTGSYCLCALIIS
jgi:hypothetical protein